MADEVIVVFGAELDGYNAQIKSAIGANDKLEQSANDTSAQITKDFANSGKAIQQAFGGQQVSKSLDQTKKSAVELKAQIKALYDEEVRLLRISKNVATDGVGAVRKEAALLRSQLPGLNGELGKTGTAIETAAKKSQSLTGQLRNLKNEISALETSGQGGSKAFTDLTIQAAKLEDQIGDTRERVRVLASDTFKFDAAVQGVQAVAGAFAGVQGAIGLFGKESEDVNKALLKVQSSLALVAAAQELSNIVTGQGALKLGIISAAQTLYASSLGATSTALKVFRGALITTGLGALVVALGFVIAKLQQFSESSAAAAAAVKAANAAQIESAKALIKAQLELDVTRKKITQTEFDRQIALANFTNKLSAELLAQKRRLADAELEIESAKQKRLVLLVTAPLVDANKVVRDAEAKKAAIVRDGEKTIANLRGEFNAQEQNRIIEAKNKEVEATKVKFADLRVLNAEILLAQNKDSFIAQEELIRAKLAVTIRGFEEEKAEAIKQGGNLIQANKVFYAQVKLAEIQSNQEILALRKDFQVTSGLVVEANAKLNQSKLRVLNAELAVLQNKDSLEAQKELIKAKLQETLRGYEIEKAEAIKQGTAIEEANATFQARVKLAEQKARDEDVEATKKANLKKLESDEEYTTASIGLAERLAATQKETNQKIFDESVKIAGALFDFGAQLNANKIADLESSKEKELAAAGDNAQKRKEIEEKYIIEVRKLQRKQAIADKAQALFEVAINTAAAVAKSLKNPTLIPFVVALGAIQAATIAATPIPKFEKGGLVKGPRHSQGGVLAELEGDEYITNRKATKRNRPLLEAINQGKDKEFIYKRFQVPIIQANQNAAINSKLNAKLDSARMERELQLSRKSEKNNTRDVIKAIANNKSLRNYWN
jgi:hypothetical protein